MRAIIGPVTLLHLACGLRASCSSQHLGQALSALFLHSGCRSQKPHHPLASWILIEMMGSASPTSRAMVVVVHLPTFRGPKDASRCMLNAASSDGGAPLTLASYPAWGSTLARVSLRAILPRVRFLAILEMRPNFWAAILTLAWRCFRLRKPLFPCQCPGQ